MKRSGLKKWNLADLVVRRDVNFRDDYDVPSMKEEIVQAGRILEPLHIAEDGTVLKGNRRTMSAQELVADPKCPQDLLKALSVIDVFVYSDMTDKEKTELILDHGSQKPLTRVEIVKATWRLQKQMYSERDIIVLLYNQLARYTGNTRKAYEAQALPAGEEREKFLKSWLHGTVGNYIMAAGQMGEFVREQFLLTDLAIDRALTEDEKKQVKFATSRDRINKLASAKKADKEKGGWTVAEGGVTFNKLLEDYIAEDAGGKKPRNKGVSAEDMEKTAESMQSGLGMAFLMCAGKLGDNDKAKVEALDCEIHRRDKIFAEVTANVDRINDTVQFTGAQVKTAFQKLIAGSPDDFAKAFGTFIG